MGLLNKVLNFINNSSNQSLNEVKLGLENIEKILLIH